MSADRKIKTVTHHITTTISHRYCSYQTLATNQTITMHGFSCQHNHITSPLLSPTCVYVHTLTTVATTIHTATSQAKRLVLNLAKFHCNHLLKPLIIIIHKTISHLGLTAATHHSPTQHQEKFSQLSKQDQEHRGQEWATAINLSGRVVTQLLHHLGTKATNGRQASVN